MNRSIGFLLFLVFIAACSKEAPKIVKPDPFTPDKNCRIQRLAASGTDQFSYEFYYEGDRLTGLLMTSPSFNWPIHHAFRYTGDNLTTIVQTLDNGFPDYDSLIVRFTYDSQGRPVSYEKNRYINNQPYGSPGQEYEYQTDRITGTLTQSGFASSDIFILDEVGNVRRHEVRSPDGDLIRFEESEFDNWASPFRSFPLAVKLYFNVQLAAAWNNNVTKMQCTSFADGETLSGQFDYAYNSEGFPTQSTADSGHLLSYQMAYDNCD